MVDLYKSDSEQWVLDGDTLIAPFNAVPGLGDNVAKRLLLRVLNVEFLSKEESCYSVVVCQRRWWITDENGKSLRHAGENQLALF